MAWLQTYISGSLQNWGNRKELTIPYSKVDTTISGYPVLISLGANSGINGADTRAAVEEAVPIEVLFEDDFSSADGAGWYTNPGSTPATYTSGYMYFHTTGHQERLINTVDYGDNWEVTYKHINRGLGSGDDQMYVEAYLDEGSAHATSWIRTYYRTYNSGDQYLKLQYLYDSGSAVDLHTGQKYNMYSAAQSNLMSWVKIRKQGATLSFRYWREDQVEPAYWDYSGTPANIEYFNQTGRMRSYVSTQGAEGGARIEYVKIETAGGKKLAVADSSGDTEQYVEIEYVDAWSKNMVLWSKVENLSSTADTTLYLYYDHRADDNDTYVDYTGSSVARNVWENNFQGVWHFNTVPDTTKDSSSSANDGTAYSMDASNLELAAPGLAYSFDGSEYVQVTHAGSNIRPSTNYTVEVYFVPTTSETVDQILCKGNSDSNALQIRADSGSLSFMPGGGVYTPRWPWVQDEWSYAAGVHDTTVARLYINGSPFSTVPCSATPNNTNNFNIGSRWDAYLFNGSISEMRYSTTVRSPAWIKATNYTLRDDFIYFGGAVQYKVSGYVYEQGSPVQRELYLYQDSTGYLIDSTTSAESGYYELVTPFYENHYIVCKDDNIDLNYNHLIIRDVQLESA